MTVPAHSRKLLLPTPIYQNKRWSIVFKPLGENQHGKLWGECNHTDHVITIHCWQDDEDMDDTLHHEVCGHAVLGEDEIRAEAVAKGRSVCKKILKDLYDE